MSAADPRAAAIERTSAYLSAAVALADEVRAILHYRDEVPDGALLDRVDEACDRYWSMAHSLKRGALVADLKEGVHGPSRRDFRAQVTVTLDRTAQVRCVYNDGGVPALVIDTSHMRITITPAETSLPHLPASADLSGAA